MLITNGELNPGCEPFKNINPQGANYGIRMYSGSEYPFDNFIDPLNYPLPGHISIWFNDDGVLIPDPGPGGGGVTG